MLKRAQRGVLKSTILLFLSGFHRYYSTTSTYYLVVVAIGSVNIIQGPGLPIHSTDSLSDSQLCRKFPRNVPTARPLNAGWRPFQRVGTLPGPKAAALSATNPAKFGAL